MNKEQENELIESIKGARADVEKIQIQKRMLEGKLRKAKIENDIALVEKLERQLKEIES